MKYNDLTISTLLKADVNTQLFPIYRDNVETNLISNEQFWGKNKNDGLYLHYLSEEAEGYIKTYEGINNANFAQNYKGEECTTWIHNNILHSETNRLCVIQGYAGCGKTTFVNKILQDVSNDNTKFSYCINDYYNFYEGYSKDTEDFFISSSIQIQLINYIVETLKEDYGWKVYTTFISLFDSSVKLLSPFITTNIATIFDKDGTLYKKAHNIYKNRNNCNEKIINEFINQFLGAYNGKLYGAYFEKHRQDTFRIINTKLDIILCIDCLWRCAVALNKKEKIQYIVYDNLDIIENPRIISSFFETLRSVMSKYNRFKQEHKQKDFPIFVTILTVRIITFSSFTQFIEVPTVVSEPNPVDEFVCDISNLYSYVKIMKHRIKFLKENLSNIIPQNTNKYDEIEESIKRIENIPDIILLDLKYTDLLNHNFRACSNMLEKIIKNNKFLELETKIDTNPNKLIKYSCVLHIICEILKKENILQDLGYNLCDYDKRWVPTTLSRVILTFLDNAKKGCVKDIPLNKRPDSPDVSFKSIIDILDKMPFDIRIKNESLEDTFSYLEKNNSLDNNINIIITTISNMLKRNNHDKIEGIELWRRPIYYTSNGIPPTNNKCDQDFISYLKDQAQNLNMKNNNYTKFCITDEGSTFIEKIATHFEFYSVRYNSDALPIYFATNATIIDNTINNVFIQVKNCVKKQLWFMNYYIKKYNINKKDYLNKWFHPRTEHFEPQLHIVRTIYDHISYLNEYRDYICKCNKKNNELNICIVKWIGKYLDLYCKEIYPILEGTDEEYNNRVWLDLKYLYWLVYIDDNKKGVYFLENKQSDFITINRKHNDIKRTYQNNKEYKNYRITKKELLEDPMLIT